MIIQIIALIMDLAIALAVGLSALTRPRTPASLSLMLLAIFIAIWSLCDILIPEPAVASLLPLLAAAVYLVSMFAASAQFTYAVWHSNRQHWVHRVPIAALAVMPVLT